MDALESVKENLKKKELALLKTEEEFKKFSEKYNSVYTTFEETKSKKICLESQAETKKFCFDEFEKLESYLQEQTAGFQEQLTQKKKLFNEGKEKKKKQSLEFESEVTNLSEKMSLGLEMIERNYVEKKIQELVDLNKAIQNELMDIKKNVQQLQEKMDMVSNDFRVHEIVNSINMIGLQTQKEELTKVISAREEELALHEKKVTELQEELSKLNSTQLKFQ